MLVDEKFREWTAGLEGRDALVSVFEHIRDIPYSLAVPMMDPETAMEQMLRLGKGSCGPKHYLMAEMFHRLGFDTVYATFAFLWDDPDLRYPPELRRLAHGLPVAHHLACRGRIGTSWVLVDATWDLPLARGGFPVNRHWDGRSDTLCAVKPLQSAVRTAFCRTGTNEPYRRPGGQDVSPCDGEQDHPCAGEHFRYYRRKISERSPDEIGRIRQFNQDFDAWLETLRKIG